MENKLNNLLEELNDIVEMMKFDRELKGQYMMSDTAKKYSIAIQESIEDAIINNGGKLNK